MQDISVNLKIRRNGIILAKVTSNPSMKCENCGAVANSGRNLCMPTELS